MKPTTIQQFLEWWDKLDKAEEWDDSEDELMAVYSKARRLAEIEAKEGKLYTEAELGAAVVSALGNYKAKEKPVAMNGHGIPVCPECGTAIEACKNCPPKPPREADGEKGLVKELKGMLQEAKENGTNLIFSDAIKEAINKFRGGK